MDNIQYVYELHKAIQTLYPTAFGISGNTLDELKVTDVNGNELTIDKAVVTTALNEGTV